MKTKQEVPRGIPPAHLHKCCFLPAIIYCFVSGVQHRQYSIYFYVVFYSINLTDRPHGGKAALEDLVDNLMLESSLQYTTNLMLIGSMMSFLTNDSLRYLE